MAISCVKTAKEGRSGEVRHSSVQEGELLRKQLERWAILLPLLKEEGFSEVGQGAPVAPAKATEEELFAQFMTLMASDPSIEEGAEETAAYLVGISGTPAREREETVKEVKLSIYRLFFQVFGQETMDLNGKIQMVGVVGLQEEAKRMAKVREGLDQLQSGYVGKKYMGANGTMKATGIVAGITAGFAILGAVVGAVVGSKIPIFGTTIGASAGLAAGTAIGTLIGAALGAGITAGISDSLKIDDGLDSTKLSEQQAFQLKLSTLGQLVSQEMNMINTTQMTKSGQDSTDIRNIMNSVMELVRKTYSVR